MIMALDIGNTHIFGGVFVEGKLAFRFRKGTSHNTSSDELGIFLRTILKENSLDRIEKIACCSVVPDVLHTIRNCSLKYFSIEPSILTSTNTNIKVLYKNPLEVGSDRIANALAATNLYPGKNIIVVDFGTANTFCAISKNLEYLGGLITPGLKLSMNALVQNTAKLPKVEIKKPENFLGSSTVESIQSGLYHGSLIMVQGLINKMKDKRGWCNHLLNDAFVIGTGGFSSLFANENLFDTVDQSLVLKGLHIHTLQLTN